MRWLVYFLLSYIMLNIWILDPYISHHDTNFPAQSYGTKGTLILPLFLKPAAHYKKKFLSLNIHQINIFFFIQSSY